MWDSQLFEELLRKSKHFFMFFPRVFRPAVCKLLHLVKLVNPEYALHILAVRASFLPEAWADSRIADWQLLAV